MKAKRFAVLLLLFAGCFVSLAQPAVAPRTSAPPAKAVAPAVAFGRHSLWRVEGKSNVVYLLGSVHLLKPEHYPLAPVIDSAFTNARIAVFEADVSKMTDVESQLGIITKGQLPEGESLADYLTPATYAAVSNQFVNIGFP